MFEVGSHLTSCKDTNKKSIQKEMKEHQVIKHSEAIRPFKGSQFKRIETRPCMLTKNTEPVMPYKRKMNSSGGRNSRSGSRNNKKSRTKSRSGSSKRMTKSIKNEPIKQFKKVMKQDKNERNQHIHTFGSGNEEPIEECLEENY